MIASEGYTSSKFSASSGFRLAPAGFNDMLVEVEEIIWAGGFGGRKGTVCLKVQNRYSSKDRGGARVGRCSLLQAV